jgi:predicted small lipoprotein YifL
MSRTFSLIVAASLVIPLASCGRKTALEAPSAVPAVEGEKAPAPEPKEDKPFILDGLIQ